MPCPLGNVFPSFKINHKPKGTQPPVSLFSLLLLCETVGHGTTCPYKVYSVENVPPERFQNYGITSGTQGGAVLFAPPSKSCRFSHPPSTCAQKHGHGEFRRLRTATQEAPRPLRESVLYLGACRLRRQIFREMKGKTEEILCGFPSIFLKYLGKDASKMRANRCKTDSKTSPAALSWSSLMR